MGKPTVWVLCSEAMGGDGESLAIAEALDLPYERRFIRFKSRQRGLKKYAGRWPKPHLGSVDTQGSDQLKPPWPDLVIAAGRRQAPVALWIKQANGGKTRIVMIGYPYAPSGTVDLQVAAYVRPAPDAIARDFPLMRKPATAQARDISDWRSRLQDFPKPWTSLLLGGPAYRYRMTPDDAEEMVSRALAGAAADGGSLLVSTSRRTPEAVCERLARLRKPGLFVHVWKAGQQLNPYRAMLAESGDVIVSCESASMIMEAIRSGCRCHIYPLPQKHAGLRSLGLSSLVFDPATGKHRTGLQNIATRLLNWGLIEQPGHIAALNGALVAGGHAAWFESPRKLWQPSLPPDMLPAIVSRIRPWFDLPSDEC